MKPLYFEKLLSIFDKDEFWTYSGDTYKNYINMALKESGSIYSYDDFKKSYLKFNGKIPYFTKVVDLIKHLQQIKKCYMGILSNISEFDVELLKRYIDIDSLDFVFLSFKLGIQKPNNKVYDIVENVSKICPENILFIDDRKGNIEVAKQHGWNTCCATGNEFEKIKNDCYKFLKIND